MDDNLAIQREKITTLLIDAIKEYDPALENPVAVVLALISTLVIITREGHIDKDSLRTVIDRLTKAWDLSHEMVKEEEPKNVEVTIH